VALIEDFTAYKCRDVGLWGRGSWMWAVRPRLGLSLYLSVCAVCDFSPSMCAMRFVFPYICISL
jgi:hypothetical protein